MHWQRQFLHPTLKALDAPTREECTAQRPRSNTPLAALTLLNDPSFVAAARAFAVRMMHHGGRRSERLRFGFELATGRRPRDAELEVLDGLWIREARGLRARPSVVEALLQGGLPGTVTESAVAASSIKIEKNGKTSTITIESSSASV